MIRITFIMLFLLSSYLNCNSQNGNTQDCNTVVDSLNTIISSKNTMGLMNIKSHLDGFVNNDINSCVAFISDVVNYINKKNHDVKIEKLLHQLIKCKIITLKSIKFDNDTLSKKNIRLLIAYDSLQQRNDSLSSSLNNMDHINDSIKKCFEKINKDSSDCEAEINKLKSKYKRALDSLNIKPQPLPFSFALKGMALFNNKQSVTSYPGMVFEAGYHISNTSALYFALALPFDIVTYNTTASGNNDNVWNNSVCSAGYIWSIYSFGSFDCLAGMGAFYGYSQLKSTNIPVKNKSEVELVGLNPRLSLSYNNFGSSKVAEAFFSVDGYLSNKKIIFQAENSYPFDFGYFLLSFSLGLRIYF